MPNQFHHATQEEAGLEVNNQSFLKTNGYHLILTGEGEYYISLLFNNITGWPSVAV